MEKYLIKKKIYRGICKKNKNKEICLRKIKTKKISKKYHKTKKISQFSFFVYRKKDNYNKFKF